MVVFALVGPAVGRAVRLGDGHVGACAELLLWAAAHRLGPVLARACERKCGGKIQMKIYSSACCVDQGNKIAECEHFCLLEKCNFFADDQPIASMPRFQMQLFADDQPIASMPRF